MIGRDNRVRGWYNVLVREAGRSQKRALAILAQKDQYVVEGHGVVRRSLAREKLRRFHRELNVFLVLNEIVRGQLDNLQLTFV